MSAELQVFGIRHHGPGSALALQRALREMEPDCLLVEAPEEAEPLLEQLLHPGISLPIALLIYQRLDFSRAVFLPFAEFSPELQAVRFALQRGIPIRAIDLPMRIQLAESLSTHTSEAGEEAARIRLDPLHYLATLAGYTDSERFWDAQFEQMDNPGEIFGLILEMMGALREAPVRKESEETEVREAWMRQQVRSAQETGFKRIAVVCGAWHAPVLNRVADFPVKADRALLRGLKKEKVAAAWIPWSYERLAFQSGYGSGVISPAWYELLFRKRKGLAAHWMARAGRLFRQERFDVSPAHLQEAVRLAEALAAMRSKSVPGIAELEEAAVSVLCEGRPERLQVIRERLVIGLQVGKVPAAFAQTPLQQDLVRCVKSARLGREFESSEKHRKELDLRVAANLRASQLLHRLQLLDIPWGDPGYIRGETLGSFREVWNLKWKPDFNIRLIQASLWGTRIDEAARQRAIDRSAKANALPEALALLHQVLSADLPAACRHIMERIQAFAAVTQEVDLLLSALPTLVHILRYGNVRKTDREAVAVLVTEIVPRICIGLPAAVSEVDEGYARDWFSLIIQGHQSLHLLLSDTGRSDWYAALSEAALNHGTNPLLAGLSLRLLLDERVWSVGSVESVVRRELSNPGNALRAAWWLEGFASGPALLLLHTPGLWPLLDTWVCHLPVADFKEIVPVLRRTFSRFSQTEKQLLKNRITRAQEQPQIPGTRFHPEHQALLKTWTDTWLGRQKTDE